MIKLLFLAHTGSGEPPMAEFIMKQLIKEAGLEDRIYVSSARLEKKGGPLCEEGQKVLAAHGIPSTPKEALPLEWGTYDQYNYIFLMDNPQDPRLFNTMGGDVDNKISLLSAQAGYEGGIANPYGGATFEEAYHASDVACRKLLEKLKGWIE
ncbi:hypothetical protein [uncultured Dialister sp.]|jgi:protein-tyrosine phosphatase|uniref:arsenate reductase/protein-tyrosine-phosphatase family protein n=1 Tax=Dialister sp. TaxID=1955814 RepID=UPI0025E267F4|nr:hypothetical protein [uncultured Dialister sp.]